MTLKHHARDVGVDRIARDDAVQRGAVGKRTLVEALEPSPAGAVQRRVAGAESTHDPSAVATAAARGTSGAAGPLPHFDRIQRLFGRHDVSGVRAHVGGPAAEGAGAMGAQAFATGNQVAFAAQPDLHTAAHEAAHVVQQRGGVQLKGGVGQAGDRYEQHADAVADLVVQGKSAEHLLEAHAGANSAAPGVQRMIVSDSQATHVLDWPEAVLAISTHPSMPQLSDAAWHQVQVMWKDIRAVYTVDEIVDALAGVVPPQQTSPTSNVPKPGTPQRETSSTPSVPRPGTPQRETSPTPSVPKPGTPQQETSSTSNVPQPEPKSEIATSTPKEPSGFRPKKFANKQNIRKRSEKLDEETESPEVNKKPTEKQSAAKKRYTEPEDSGFMKWIKAHHNDKADIAEELDIMGASEAVVDRDGARAVEHILAATGARERLLRAIIGLNGKGVRWADICCLTPYNNLAGYLDDLDTAVTHIQHFGGDAVAHYGKQALESFQTGSVSVGEHYFKQAWLSDDGVLHGGHLQAKWNDFASKLGGVQQLWTDTIESATITQYEYRNNRGDKKLKTVFANVHAGNAILNKALIDGIKAKQARASGAWEYPAVLASGRVTVRFNGAALQHIT